MQISEEALRNNKRDRLGSKYHVDAPVWLHLKEEYGNRGAIFASAIVASCNLFARERRSL